MIQSENPALPLSGIRVLDLTVWLQGPLASTLLADLGAEVIKIEKPGMGDFSRGAQHLMGRSLILPDGHSLLWEIGNRNKKSVTLNLNKAKGKEVLHRLVRSSDIFVTNLSVGALREMEADYETIASLNPKIIYTRGSGFGSKGPDSEAPCQDTTGYARSGFMMHSRQPDEEPFYHSGAMSDVISGTMMAFGTLAALIARERSGVAPQFVEASQLSSMMWLQCLNIALFANLQYDFIPWDRKKAGSPLLNIYRCQDGKWIAIGLYVTDRWWHDLCDVMGIPECEYDPRFENEPARIKNSEDLIHILDKAFAMKPIEHWDGIFKQKKFWFSVVNAVPDLLCDTQVIANKYIDSFESGLKLCTLPFQLGTMKVPQKGRSPELGENTEEVLVEIGGYSWEEVGTLREEKIL